uniref:Uncharacterized protein n=1 Tax=Candidatus Kentrum sp. MB TaxID=2138164 RepID=A0A450XZ15_9GAMM|nr:MAG: hypothetical protein BECKMB1821I_GA0114274_10757 [Candidatus Kentron sp. MB]VFK76891.1 MAG: hypothetical protein BECKMB1821H_GA0114242_10815 [Candidatus Kentron sp. MB]
MMFGFAVLDCWTLECGRKNVKEIQGSRTKKIRRLIFLFLSVLAPEFPYFGVFGKRKGSSVTLNRFYESGATGLRCQISSLYSRMVRSVENLPLVAVLRMLMRVQRSLSW